ncbi:MAG: Protein rof [Candidatus Erwinia impunctatus]|nr:Protein rof [Culicoides impunctatus]
MSTNELYAPINCDDYDTLELACQKRWRLALILKNGEQWEVQPLELFSRKNIEYLTVQVGSEQRDLRLDHIHSFSHPELGNVVISTSE